MPELKDAITGVEIIIAAVLLVLLGDYVGYKIGPWRLAGILGILTLVSIVAFVVYAAIRLA